jgi:hypothetical protein
LYLSTYVERDLRQVLNVRDLAQFEVFLKLCAGRTGQLLNLAALGNDTGISHNTAHSKGLEVDLVLDFGREVELVGIKSGKTLNADFFAALEKLAGLHGGVRVSYLVYGGRETLRQQGVEVLSWMDVGGLS